jgi:heme exporter protein C
MKGVELLFLLAAAVLLPLGAYLGLAWAPPDRMMGEVQRIMYVHVPSAWMTLLAYTCTLGASLYYIWRKRPGADSLAEASAEVGVFFNALTLVLGSIWGRPTWGVWWTWDPRLTTVAIMFVLFAGYLSLRRFVDDAERRATWSAVFAIIAYADIPLVWFSVRWWRSLHQIQSSPSTVDPHMVVALRVNAFAFLALLVLFIWRRYRIAYSHWRKELAPPEAT